jgi:RNA polymerase primary sigma factor
MTEEIESRMSVVELQELDEVKGLLAKGQQVGVLSTARSQAMSARPRQVRRRRLHGFSGFEIELVEDIDPAIAASARSSGRPTSAAGAS